MRGDTRMANDQLKIPARRRLLSLTGHLALASVGVPSIVRAMPAVTDGSRNLSLDHTHTRERIALTYAVDGKYIDPALTRMNHFLRDHYSGIVGSIDPRLLDLLYRLQVAVGSQGGYQVISGYRSPNTNERLRGKGGKGVARHSLHMEGRAIDVRMPGVPLQDVRDAALSLKLGGVGFYPRDQFVHVDTGKVRSW